METPVTKLRNLMGPVVNYFAMKQKPIATANAMKLIESELALSIKNIEEIKEILRSIPDDACEIKSEAPLLVALRMLAYGSPVAVDCLEDAQQAAKTALSAYQQNKVDYSLGDEVYYPSDMSPFRIVGIRESEVEIYGDFSGGINYDYGKCWVPKADVKPFDYGKYQEHVRKFREQNPVK